MEGTIQGGKCQKARITGAPTGAGCEGPCMCGLGVWIFKNNHEKVSEICNLNNIDESNTMHIIRDLENIQKYKEKNITLPPKRIAR